MTHAARTILLIAAAVFGCALAGADDRREKQIKELNQYSSRLNKAATSSATSEEREFLHERVSELLNRARKSTDDRYLFGRLLAAADDFLDASDQIEEAIEGSPRNSDTQERAARELENTYFDLMQGEHFARQSGDPRSKEYIRTGRRLYQSARAAYEKEAYARARDLGEAAREIVAGLESLAQAAVRIPTPPKL